MEKLNFFNELFNFKSITQASVCTFCVDYKRRAALAPLQDIHTYKRICAFINVYTRHIERKSDALPFILHYL